MTASRILVINLPMQRALLLTVLLAFAICQQMVPIPRQEYGFDVGAQGGQLHIQAFVDFQCPDSKASFTALKSVIQTVDLQKLSVRITFQHAPLPYHHYAYRIHVAFIYVQKHNPTNAFKVMDYLFANQEQFTEEKLIDKPGSEFSDELSTIVAAVGGVNQSDLRNELNFFSDTWNELRFSEKYSWASHGISGAPMFVINSVQADGFQTYGYQDWVEFIKKYTS